MSDVSTYLLPIPGTSPAGINARYHPSFVRLEEQVARLTSLTGGLPDWAFVADDATIILIQQSKDLLAAVYVARAWYELRGLPGLYDGLLVIEHVLTIYWEDGFPALERVRARRSALQWLSDGLAPGLAAADSAAPGRATRDTSTIGHACASVVQRLHALLRLRFPAGDTGLGGLLRAFDRHSATIAAEAPAEAVSPVTTSSSFTPVSERAAALQRLHEIASWFLLHEPHSPVGFLAQRAAELGGQPFHTVFRDLLANHQPAQQELWHVLGIPTPASSN